MMVRKTLGILVISGPSGAGKSTLLTRLFAEHPDTFTFSVSHTTREPRVGEKPGKDYYYISRPEMEASILRGEFLEHTEFSKNLYGTSLRAIQQVQQDNRICVLDIDLQGVLQVKDKLAVSDPLYVFIQPPSIEALEARLRSRNTDQEGSIQRRLAAAREAIEYAQAHLGFYDKVIVNDDLDAAYQELKALIFNRR